MLALAAFLMWVVHTLTAALVSRRAMASVRASISSTAFMAAPRVLELAEYPVPASARPPAGLVIFKCGRCRTVRGRARVVVRKPDQQRGWGRICFRGLPAEP